MPTLIQAQPRPPIVPAYNYAPSANMALEGLNSGIAIAKTAIRTGFVITALGVIGSAFSTSTTGQVISATVGAIGIGITMLGRKRLKEMQEWL